MSPPICLTFVLRFQAQVFIFSMAQMQAHLTRHTTWTMREGDKSSHMFDFRSKVSGSSFYFFNGTNAGTSDKAHNMDYEGGA